MIGNILRKFIKRFFINKLLVVKVMLRGNLLIFIKIRHNLYFPCTMRCSRKAI